MTWQRSEGYRVAALLNSICIFMNGSNCLLVAWPHHKGCSSYLNPETSAFNWSRSLFCRACLKTVAGSWQSCPHCFFAGQQKQMHRCQQAKVKFLRLGLPLFGSFVPCRISCCCDDAFVITHDKLHVIGAVNMLLGWFSIDLQDACAGPDLYA